MTTDRELLDEAVGLLRKAIDLTWFDYAAAHAFLRRYDAAPPRADAPATLPPLARMTWRPLAPAAPAREEVEADAIVEVLAKAAHEQLSNLAVAAWRAGRLNDSDALTGASAEVSRRLLEARGRFRLKGAPDGK